MKYDLTQSRDSKPACWIVRPRRRRMIAGLLALSLACVTPLAVAQTGGSAAASAFFQALEQNDAKTVRTWLLRGMDPNRETADKVPAIVFAASHKAYSAVLALLESPETDINRTNPRGENALMMASFHGEAQIVQALIKKGAEVNKTDWAPLHYAATGGHAEIAKLLLDNHAYVDAQSPNKTTPLMMAARHKNVTLAKLLVEEGADPTQRNEAGLTVADYFQRYGETVHAAWFRERAAEFERKYGTVEKPKVSSPAPSQ